MKLKLLMLLLFTISFFALSSAQTDSLAEPAYSVVEEMPEFPGGEQAMMKFLIENIKYPSIAREQNIQGMVFVKFIVTKTGNVDSVTVSKSVHSELDKEAIRVVKAMPTWKPGKQSGRPVNCYFNLPIRFKLDETKKNKK